MGLLDTTLSRLLCFIIYTTKPHISHHFQHPHTPFTPTLTYFSLILPDDDCFLHKFLYICVLKQT